MREFKEEAITREDRFHEQFYQAIIEEIQLLREEIKELKKNEPKRKSHAKPRSDSSNAE